MKKGNGYGDGTFIESRLFLSPAWMSLGQKGTAPTVSSFSAQMLVLFLGKRQFGKAGKKGERAHVRTDGNKLTLTYAELQARGISQAMITRSIDELLAKGFIEIVHAGGCFNKDKTVFALSDDFLRWRFGDPPVRFRVRDVVRGYQKKARPSLKVVGENLKLPSSTGDTHTHVNVGEVGKRHARQRGTP